MIEAAAWTVFHMLLTSEPYHLEKGGAKLGMTKLAEPIEIMIDFLFLFDPRINLFTYVGECRI